MHPHGNQIPSIKPERTLWLGARRNCRLWSLNVLAVCGVFWMELYLCVLSAVTTWLWSWRKNTLHVLWMYWLESFLSTYEEECMCTSHGLMKTWNHLQPAGLEPHLDVNLDQFWLHVWRYPGLSSNSLTWKRQRICYFPVMSGHVRWHHRKHESLWEQPHCFSVLSASARCSLQPPHLSVHRKMFPGFSLEVCLKCVSCWSG